MNTNQLAAYRKQLLDHDNRLEVEIDEIANEIASGGIAVGEHDIHVRKSPEAQLAIGRNEEGIRRDVRAALARIEAGTFGKCEDCGEMIAKVRLDAIPYTAYCIDCETNREAS